jgi:hypothetical protein
MTPQREEWNDRALDRLAKDVDDLSNEFEIVRRIPWEVAETLGRLDERTEAVERSVERIDRASTAGGGLTRNQLAIAVVSGLFLVAATLIGAYVQLKTSTPVPVPSR